MSTRTRRLASIALIPVLVAILAACDQATVTPDPVPATPAPTTAVATAVATAAASPDAVDSPPPASQTETDWGTIWDGIPTGFPRFTGSSDADDASAVPASDRYAVPGGDAQTIATWLQTAMENATYSTEGLSGPFEDGSFVLDSVGDAGCRIQTTVAPQGNLVLVTVLYGAECPAA